MITSRNKNKGALPDFYCIGAQKSGTTWLYQMLKQHPQVHLPTMKELHYWDTRQEKPLSWYMQNFLPGLVNGDMTPSYAVLSEAKVRQIHSLTPNARVLFSMRNPLDRAWSFVQMAVGRNYKDCQPELLAGEPSKELMSFMKDRLFRPGCLARSNYAMTIRRWNRVFGEGRVWTFRYERISLDPKGLLVDICRQLGINDDWVANLPDTQTSRKVFSFAKIPFPEELRNEFLEHSIRYVEDLENLLGEKFEEWKI